MNPVATLHAEAPAGAAPVAAPRADLYVLIHKALRCFMADTLGRLGRIELDDADDVAAVLGQVAALLAQLRAHVMHENDHLHTAIEARRPGAARHTADDHVLHLDAIDNLDDELRALRDARAEQRPAMALRLYRHLADFVGENLQHMQIEETQNNAELWALYDDAALMAIHDRLMQSVPPAEMAQIAHWFGVALSSAELALVFGDLQAKAPAPVVEALLDIVRAQLDEARWARLARALGRAPVPGLMTA